MINFAKPVLLSRIKKGEPITIPRLKIKPILISPPRPRLGLIPRLVPSPRLMPRLGRQAQINIEIEQLKKQPQEKKA